MNCRSGRDCSVFERGRGSLLTHNIFLEVSTELGLVGLLGFLLMIGAKLVLNARTRRLARLTPGDNEFIHSMAWGLDGALVGYLASGFFVTVFYYPYFWINLAMTIALNGAMVRKARSHRNRRNDRAAPRRGPENSPPAWSPVLRG